MEKGFDNEEQITDSYLNDSSQEFINVPDKLEQMIKDRIQSVSPNRSRIIKRFSVVAAALLLCFGALLFSPGIHTFAKGIPVLSSLISWFDGDAGTIEAKNNGYVPAGDITVEENGCKVTISDMFIEDDRLIFTAKAEIHVNDSDFITEATENRPSPSIYINLRGYSHEKKDVTFDTLDVCRITEYGYEVNTREEYLFSKQIVKNVLLENNNNLDFDVTIWDGASSLRFGDRPSYTLKVTVPVAEENFVSTRTIELNQICDIQYIDPNLTNINLKTLKISPSRLQLDLLVTSKAGYKFEGFIKPYLKDENGKEYHQKIRLAGKLFNHRNIENKVISSGSSSSVSPAGNWSHSGENTLVFLPSIYYDTPPKKLNFCFDGYLIREEDTGKIVTIDMKNKDQDIFIDNTDLKMTINEASYKGSKLLLYVDMIIDQHRASLHAAPFRLHLKDSNSTEKPSMKGTGYPDEGTLQLNEIEVEVDERETYELEILDLLHAVEKPAEFELDIK